MLENECLRKRRMRWSDKGLEKAANIMRSNTDHSLSYEGESEDKKCTDKFCEIW